MTTRKERLKKLVKVQEQLKALHETRHASFLAAAATAETEAKELVQHFDADQSMAVLFPDLYHRRIANALVRQEASLESARQGLRSSPRRRRAPTWSSAPTRTCAARTSANAPTVTGWISSRRNGDRNNFGS